MQQSETLPTFVDINILPEELRPRRYHPLYVLAVLALVAASLALLPLFQAQRAAGDETTRLRQELNLVSGDLALVQADLAKVRGLRGQLVAAEADLASLNAERQEILGDGQELSKDLSVVVLDTPESLGIVSVSGAEGELLLSGQAITSEDVLLYADALESSGRFSEARVTSLLADDGGQITFTIEAVR